MTNPVCQAGDILIAAWTDNGASTLTTNPGGWALLASVGAAHEAGYVYWKVASAGDSGSQPTWGWNRASPRSCVVTAIKGASSSAPASVTAAPNTDGSGNVALAQATVSVAPSLVVAFVGEYTAGPTFTAPSGWTTLGTGGTDCKAFLIAKSQATTGSTPADVVATNFTNRDCVQVIHVISPA